MQGMGIHVHSMHDRELATVPNALRGRDDPNVERLGAEAGEMAPPLSEASIKQQLNKDLPQQHEFLEELKPVPDAGLVYVDAQYR